LPVSPGLSPGAPSGTSALTAGVMLVCIEAAIDRCVKRYGEITAAFLTNI